MRSLSECYGKKNTMISFQKEKKKSIYMYMHVCVNFVCVFTYTYFICFRIYIYNICLYVYIHMYILCVWVRMCVCIYILKQIKPSPHSTNTEVYHLAFQRFCGFCGLNWIKDSPGAEAQLPSSWAQGSRWDDLKTMMQAPPIYPCL